MSAAAEKPEHGCGFGLPESECYACQLEKEHTTLTKPLSAKDRRAITQTVGARVVCTDGGRGEVIGHYDDDSVYVLFGGAKMPDRTYTVALRLDDA